MQGSTKTPVKNLENCNFIYDEAVSKSLDSYNKLIAEGVSKEQARFVLPIGLKTRFVTTMNLHNWMRIIRSRTDSHAQYEIRVVANEIKELIRTYVAPNVVSFMGNGDYRF